jgi:hypothetical protein
MMAYADNGGAAVQEVSTRDEDAVLVTYPIEKSQLTSKTVFNLHSFPIRALSFSNDTYMTVYIDGEFQGVMDCEPSSHLWLCNLNVTNISSGDHTLQVGRHQRKFFVGDVAPATTESDLILYSIESCGYGALAMFVQILLHIVPWWDLIPNMNFWLESYRKWIYGMPGGIEYDWYVQLILGPLYYLSRFRRTPKWCWFFGIGLATVFLIVPMYGTFVDLDLAICWVWGFYLKEVWSHDGMLYVLFLMYTIFAALPACAYLGMWFEIDQDQKFKLWQYVEFGAMFLCIVIDGIGWGILAYLTGGWSTVLTSPVMIAFVVILSVLLGVSFGGQFTRRHSSFAAVMERELHL